MTTAAAPALATDTGTAMPPMEKPGDAVIQLKITYVSGGDGGGLHPMIGAAHFEGDNPARQLDAMNAFKASGISEKLGLPMLNFGFEGNASIPNAAHTGAQSGHSEVQVKYDTKNPGRVEEICIKGHSEAQLTAALQAFAQTSLFAKPAEHAQGAIDPNNPELMEIAARHGQVKEHTHTEHGVTTRGKVGHLDLSTLTPAEREALQAPPAGGHAAHHQPGAASPATVAASRQAAAGAQAAR